MNYKSFFLGMVSCTIIIVVVLMKWPFLLRPIPLHFITNSSYSIEQKGFPILTNAKYPFSLPLLPYSYNALEPHIDAQTLKLHHTKHQQSAIDNLNNKLKEFPELGNKTLISLLENLEKLPDTLKDNVRNSGGSHFNHTLYFTSMAPQPTQTTPNKLLTQAIIKKFESFEKFKDDFTAKALALVGSGWVWLCIDQNNELQIATTVNYDTPFDLGYYPLLVLDVWEHAYYLKYQNQRVNYVKAWWNVVNWEHVEKLYLNGMKQK